MNFYWTPDAERSVKNMALNPALRRIQDTFAKFDFEKPWPRGFGVNDVRVPQADGGWGYRVVFRIDPGVLMELSARGELVTELVVTCMRTPVELREFLREKYGELFFGVVLDASRPGEYLKEGSFAGGVDPDE